ARRGRVRAQPGRGGVDDPQPRPLRDRAADGAAGGGRRGADRGREALGVIEGDAVRSWVAAALASLEANRRRIDDLNVYPVPDGDTGTNLTLTVRAVDESMRASEASERHDLAREVTRAALMGARGNSGVILSQIVRGAAEVLGEASEIDAATLARTFRSASDAAYRAVRRPVEGTMLTAIRALA